MTDRKKLRGLCVSAGNHRKDAKAAKKTKEGLELRLLGKHLCRRLISARRAAFYINSQRFAVAR